MQPENMTSGSQSFRTSRFEGGRRRFYKWLEEMRKTVGHITKVVFEEVRSYWETDAAHIYGRFLSCTSWYEHHTIPYQGVPIGTIKNHATGTENANNGAYYDNNGECAP